MTKITIYNPDAEIIEAICEKKRCYRSRDY